RSSKSSARSRPRRPRPVRPSGRGNPARSSTASLRGATASSIRSSDETPLAKAIGYARNQRAALRRFLDRGRLPLHNNASELQRRREVIGRRNWLFVGSDEAAAVNTIFVSLLASCGLHRIEPRAYLRDLFCMLPGWSQRRVLELAPA